MKKFVLLLMAAVMIIGCRQSGTSTDCTLGLESCQCLDEDVCNNGLTCISNVCVDLSGYSFGNTDNTDSETNTETDSSVANPTCPAGQITCNDECINPAIDRRYCGAGADCIDANVGIACESGQICSNGECVVSCQEGLLFCNRECIDPHRNPEYCGTTDCTDGTVCPKGEVCQMLGECAVQCQADLGMIPCGDPLKCIDPMTDRFFCGASGQTCGGGTGDSRGKVCGTGELCVEGECVCSLPGYINCKGVCIDPMLSNVHCGAIGTCEELPMSDAGDASIDSSSGVVCDEGSICVQGECISI